MVKQLRLFPLDLRVFAGFALLLVLLAISAIVTYSNTRQLHEDTQAVARTQEVIASLDDLMRAVVDAETGQRGYLITGVPAYLEPYESALAVVDDHLADLDRLTADSPLLKERVADIKQSTAERLQILQEIVTLHDDEGFGAAQNELLEHYGKAQMDQVREQIGTLVESQRGLLFQRSQASSRSYHTAVTAGILSALVGMAAVALLAYVVARSIRQRELAAEAVHREREHLQTTLSSIGDGVIATDPEGRVTQLNRIAEELTGWTTGEAAGRDLIEVFHIVNETTGATVENPALRALEQGTIVGLANHTVLIARDGTRRAIADSAAPIRGLRGDVHGAVLVFRDVTEDRLAAEALRESESLKTAIMNTALDAIVTCDREGHVVEFNPAAERIFGYSRDEALGKDLGELIVPPSLRDRHQRGMARQLEIGAATILNRRLEMPAQRADGSEFPAELAITRIGGESAPRFTAYVRDITEEKKARVELHESRQFLAESLDALPAHIAVVDQHGVILLVNKAWKEFAQLNAGDEARCGVGTNYLDVCEASGHAATCPDGDRAARGIRDVLAGATNYLEMEYPCHSPTENRWFLMRVSGFTSGAGPRAIVSHENITSRVRAEQGIRESEANFRNLADNISQFAWMTDKSGYILWYNQQWFDYTGTTLEEMQGWGWQKVHHPDHVERVTARFTQAIESGEFWEDTFPLRGRNGEYRWFLSRARPIRDEFGDVVRWFGTNTDITEFRELQQALVEADQRKDQFLATLGHELRNPLAGILGGIEILESGTDDPGDQAEAQRIIGRQTRFMQRLVDDLLDVSRIVRGKVTLNRVDVDLAGLVREVLQDCRRDFEDRGLQSSLDICTESLVTNGDRERLRQVFTNLIHNAMKFSEPGGAIHVSVTRDGASGCRIDVRDNGIGMSADTVNGIFHPFVQADQSLERGRGGLGLGLAIVRGLVELHGGHVSGASAGLGQGSTFTVELPLSTGRPAVSTAPQFDAPTVPSRSLLVLVVDDRRDASYPLVKLLERDGHRVLTAVDGPSGVAEASKHLPDVVICDIGLPGFDGYEVARQLRSIAGLEGSLLIAVTGYGQPQDKFNAAQAGFDCHLVKPVDRDILLSRIVAWEVGTQV